MLQILRQAMSMLSTSDFLVGLDHHQPQYHSNLPLPAEVAAREFHLRFYIQGNVTPSVGCRTREIYICICKFVVEVLAIVSFQLQIKKT